MFSPTPVQTNEASPAPIPPLESSTQVVQNDPPLPPSSGIADAHSSPRSNQVLLQEQSSDDLDTPEFDWSVDKEDVTYFSNLLDDRVDTLPYSFPQSPLPEGLGFTSNCAEWLDLT